MGPGWGGDAKWLRTLLPIGEDGKSRMTGEEGPPSPLWRPLCVSITMIAADPYQDREVACGLLSELWRFGR